MNCPPDFPGVGMLTLAAGAIANSRQLLIKKGYPESACLYAAYVAPPGSVKTAPVKMLRTPFDARQAALIEEWKVELKAWEEADPKAGPRPVPQRIIVSDTTTETLKILLAQNPRGLMLLRNELAALLAGFNQYKGGVGNDKQFYMDNWDHNTIYVDRKSEKGWQGAPLIVRHPFCGLFGTIQPEVLPLLQGETRRGAPPPNDGWVDRFLFCFPDVFPQVGEQWREVDKDLLDPWRTAVHRLLELDAPMSVDEGGEIRPKLVGLTRAGKGVWEQFTKKMAEEMNREEFPGHLRGPFVKLRVYFARLGLVIHLLRFVCEEVTSPSVDGASMTRSARLISYFAEHARRVYARIHADHRVDQAWRVVRYLQRQVHEGAKGAEGGNVQWTVSRRNLHRGVWGGKRTAVCNSVQQMDQVIELLVTHNYLRAIDGEQKRSGPGRPPSSLFAINPAVFEASESAAAPPHPFAFSQAPGVAGEDSDGPVETPFDEGL
jgi:hypothetical protein